MTRTSKLLSYALSSCRQSWGRFSNAAQLQQVTQTRALTAPARDESTVPRELPAFDYTPKPYVGPSAEEVLALRKQHLSPCEYKSTRED